MHLFRYDVDIINDTMTVCDIDRDLTYGTISYLGYEQTRIQYVICTNVSKSHHPRFEAALLSKMNVSISCALHKSFFLLEAGRSRKG